MRLYLSIHTLHFYCMSIDVSIHLSENKSGGEYRIFAHTLLFSSDLSTTIRWMVNLILYFIALFFWKLTKWLLRLFPLVFAASNVRFLAMVFVAFVSFLLFTLVYSVRKVSLRDSCESAFIVFVSHPLLFCGGNWNPIQFHFVSRSVNFWRNFFLILLNIFMKMNETKLRSYSFPYQHEYFTYSNFHIE